MSLVLQFQMPGQNILPKLIQKSKRYETCMVCCSNGNEDKYGTYDIIAGFGSQELYHNPEELPSQGFQMGICSYDLKNQFHSLHSGNKEISSFPDFLFFEPEEFYKEKRNGTIETNVNTIELEPAQIIDTKVSLNWQEDLSKTEYLKSIEQIQEDIRNGVYYELNYCMHFSTDMAEELDVYSLFLEINKRTNSPFAAFVKMNEAYLLCFSPERFLRKQGKQLLSQPIKGTIKRNYPESQERLEQFKNAPKELAENTMIVDLVRNDLSRICSPGSVKVPELCGLHSFSHVHHLVSTVTGNLEENTSLEKILEATFPMGSMTGAPKLEVMKHIEKYETFKRGLYSGSVGYIENGDFDLNVVIRSLQVHKDKMHYCVGGAIVYDSIASDEYEECIAKRNGIMNTM